MVQLTTYSQRQRQNRAKASKRHEHTFLWQQNNWNHLVGDINLEYPETDFHEYISYRYGNIDVKNGSIYLWYSMCRAKSTTFFHIGTSFDSCWHALKLIVTKSCNYCKLQLVFTTCWSGPKKIIWIIKLGIWIIAYPALQALQACVVTASWSGPKKII
jgi:hypothetical protein